MALPGLAMRSRTRSHRFCTGVAAEWGGSAVHRRNTLKGENPAMASHTAVSWFAGLLLAALVAACAPLQPPPPAPGPAARPAPTPAPAARPLPNVNLAGYPPAFKEGFRDGCDSFRGTYRRDANRFAKDNDYTIGWQDGFSICRRQGK